MRSVDSLTQSTGKTILLDFPRFSRNSTMFPRLLHVYFVKIPLLSRNHISSSSEEVFGIEFIHWSTRTTYLVGFYRGSSLYLAKTTLAVSAEQAHLLRHQPNVKTISSERCLTYASVITLMSLSLLRVKPWKWLLASKQG